MPGDRSCGSASGSVSNTMWSVYVTAATSADTGLTALVGVVIGGTITILGQNVIEWQKRKGAREQQKRIVTGVARLAWDELWHAQGTLKSALKSGEWWALKHQPQMVLSNHDRRLLAEAVEWPQWENITRTWRRLSRLRSDRESIEARGLGLTSQERALIDDASESCELARAALESVAGSGTTRRFEDQTKDLRVLDPPDGPGGHGNS